MGTIWITPDQRKLIETYFKPGTKVRVSEQPVGATSVPSLKCSWWAEQMDSWKGKEFVVSSIETREKSLDGKEAIVLRGSPSEGQGSATPGWTVRLEWLDDPKLHEILGFSPYGSWVTHEQGSQVIDWYSRVYNQRKVKLTGELAKILSGGPDAEYSIVGYNLRPQTEFSRERISFSVSNGALTYQVAPHEINDPSMKRILRLETLGDQLWQWYNYGGRTATIRRGIHAGQRVRINGATRSGETVTYCFHDRITGTQLSFAPHDLDDPELNQILDIVLGGYDKKEAVIEAPAPNPNPASESSVPVWGAVGLGLMGLALVKRLKDRAAKKAPPLTVKTVQENEKVRAVVREPVPALRV